MKEGLFISILLILLQFNSADDESECNKICKEKFVGTDIEKDACAFGCGGRKSLSRGFFGYRICTGGCDKQFSNSSDDGELRACKFACSLPFEQSFFMTLDLSGDKPKWNVLKQSGGTLSRMLGTNNDMDMSLSNILLKPRILSIDPPKPSIKNDENGDSVENFFRDIFNNRFANMRSSEQVESVVKNMVQSMLDQDQFFKSRASSIAAERPFGHDILALSGPEVGNEGPDGRSIITVVENPEEQHNKNRAYSVRWIMVTFALIFLTISMLCFAIFFRRSAIDEYVRMRNNHSQHSEVVSGGPLPVKKSMIAEDAISTASWQHKEPQGDAPPAYDQVSIHSKPSTK